MPVRASTVAGRRPRRARDKILRMRNGQNAGVVPRAQALVPSYPRQLIGGLALSLTMGLAASCGGDPGTYRRDATTTIGPQPDAGENPFAPKPSDAAAEAGVVDGGVENQDAASR
jgi:hypothetical protein